MTQEKSYTPEEVAEMLKVSKYTIYEMVKRGDLTAFRIGRKLRFQDTDIEEYIEKAKGTENVFKGTIVSQDGEKYFQTGNVAIRLVTEIEGEARIIIEPDDIILAKDILKSSARNVLKGEVETVEECGPVVKILINVGIPLYAIITRHSYRDMALKPGQTIYTIFKSTAVRLV